MNNSVDRYLTEKVCLIIQYVCVFLSMDVFVLIVCMCVCVHPYSSTV